MNTYNPATCAITNIPFAASTEFARLSAKFLGIHPAFNYSLSALYSEVSKPLFSSYSSYSEVILALFIPIYQLGLISNNAIKRGAFPADAVQYLKEEYKKKAAIKIAIELIKTINAHADLIEKMKAQRELPQIVPSALDFARLLEVAKELIIQVKGKAFVKNASANGRAALELKFSNIETVETYAKELMIKSTRTDYLLYLHNLVESYPEVFTSKVAEEKLKLDDALEVVALTATKNYSVLAENYENLNTLQTMLLQVADKVGINAIEHAALMKLLDFGAAKVLEVLRAKHKYSLMVDIGTTTYKSKGITVNIVNCDTLAMEDLMPTTIGAVSKPEVIAAPAEVEVEVSQTQANKVDSLKALMAKLAAE